MKYSIFTFFFAIILLIACTKEKTPVTPPSIINSDCPDTIKFSNQILPMLTDNCFGCHNNGTSPTLSNHTNISSNATKILKTLKGELQLMPQGGPALNDSLIKQFECWINQGKMNN
jgi:hypothetical protein